MHARYMTPEGAAAYARKYERGLLRRLSNRRELALVGRALDVLGGAGPLLDVPCGAGRLVPVLLDRAERVTGVDASPAMLEVAAAALAAPVREGRLALVRGSVGDLPFSDAAFEAAVCWRLLHHLTDRASRARALSELRRVSRRGVVVSFADAGSWKARFRRRRRAAPRTVALTTDALRGEARDAGLDVARTWRLASAFSQLGAAVLRPR